MLETDDGRVEFKIDPYPVNTPLTSVQHAGMSWTSISRQPLDALDALEPYLRLRAKQDELASRVAGDVYATQTARPTPTPTPLPLCRTPSPPSRAPLPSAAASPPLRPGDQVRVGDTINLAAYFDLPFRPEPPTTTRTGSFATLSASRRSRTRSIAPQRSLPTHRRRGSAASSRSWSISSANR